MRLRSWLQQGLAMFLALTLAVSPVFSSLAYADSTEETEYAASESDSDESSDEVVIEEVSSEETAAYETGSEEAADEGTGSEEAADAETESDEDADDEDGSEEDAGDEDSSEEAADAETESDEDADDEDGSEEDADEGTGSEEIVDNSDSEGTSVIMSDDEDADNEDSGEEAADAATESDENADDEDSDVESVSESSYSVLSTDDEEETEADDSGDDGEDEDTEEPTEASWDYDEESKTLTIGCYGDWEWAWFGDDWNDDDMIETASEAETIVFNGYLRYLSGTMLAQFASLQTIELNCETYYQNYDDEGNMEDGWDEYYASNLWEEDGIIYFEDYGGDSLGQDTDDEGNEYDYIESNWYSRHFCWAGIGSDEVTVIEEITDVASYAFAGCSSDGVTVWFDGDAPNFYENAFAGASVTAYYCTDRNWSVEQWTNSYGSDNVTWVSYGWNPSYVNAAASENELTIDGDSIEVELDSGQDEDENPYYAYYTITIPEDGTGFYNLYAYSESGSTYAYLYYGGNESEGDITWDCWNEGDRDDDGNASLSRMLYAGDTYYYVVRFDDYGSVEGAAAITAGVTSLDLSGTIDDTDVTWSIDADGLLTLSGEGEVPDYDDGGIDSTPWGSYRDYITGLYIGEGITYIGNWAFEDCYNLENIWFEGEPEISEYAFGDDGVITQWDERIVLYTGTYGGTLTYVAWDEDGGYGELNRGEYSDDIDLYDGEDENDYYVVEGENIVIVYLTQSFLNNNYYNSRGSHSLTLVFNEVDEDGNAGDETKRYDLSYDNTVYTLEYDGHYYYAFMLSDAESWEDAVAYCESLGGYLAAITSEEENAAITEYISGYGFEHTYIGFTDEETEGTWVWVNGEDTDYTNWADGEPNNDGDGESYAYLYQGGEWNDAVYAENGGSSEVFLCEWDSESDVPEEILELLSSGDSDGYDEYLLSTSSSYYYAYSVFSTEKGVESVAVYCDGEALGEEDYTWAIYEEASYDDVVCYKVRLSNSYKSTLEDAEYTYSVEITYDDGETRSYDFSCISAYVIYDFDEETGTLTISAANTDIYYLMEHDAEDELAAYVDSVTGMVIGENIYMMAPSFLSAFTKLETVTISEDYSATSEYWGEEGSEYYELYELEMFVGADGALYYTASYTDLSGDSPDVYGYYYVLLWVPAGTESFTVPEEVTYLVMENGRDDVSAFTNCSSLKELYFTGDACEITESSFAGLSDVTVYYPQNNSTWDDVIDQDYGGENITWVAYDPDSTSVEVIYDFDEETGILTVSVENADYYFLTDADISEEAAEYKDSVTQIVFGENVLFVYPSFLSAFSNLESVTVAEDCGSYSGYVTYGEEGSEDYLDYTYVQQLYVGEDGALYVSSVVDGIVNGAETSYELIELFWVPASTESFTVPAGVTYIHSGAFANCGSLTTLYFTDDAILVNLADDTDALSGLSDVTIYYPEGSSDWAEYIDQDYGAENVTWVAYGHSYDSAVFTWAEDYSSATLTLKCSSCGDTQTVTAQITSETTAAGCETAGSIVYTATAVYDDVTYTDTVTETIEATGHSWNDSNICSNCGELKTSTVASATVTLSQTSYTYSGRANTPTVTVTINNTTLTSGTDYTVSYSNNTAAGTATVTITGTGSYTGITTATFTISAKSISSATVTLSQSSYTYSGSANKPTVTVKDGSTTLTSGTHYTVTYSNNTNAGTATVTITGKGNYTGTTTKTFTISAKSISSATVTLSKTSYTYSGSANTPTVTVKDGSTTLTSGTHYTVSYSNNTNAGTATVTITGKGNYTGTTTKTFTISAKSISSATVTLSKTSYTYSGSANKPTVTVKDGSTTLTSGTHYTVTYSNNTNAGTATVTITGTGNYTGTTSKTFTISAKSISSATVTLSKTSYTYSGSANKPSVTVKDGSTTLTSGTHYTVSYSNNTNAGTATVTITGTGNYTGTTSKTFTISAKSISSATVTLSKTSYTYSGSANKPTVTVKDGSTTLTSGTHYTVTYSNNTNAGTATVTITGKGNYTGTTSKTFTISAKSISSATVTLSKTSYTYSGSANKPSVTVKDGSTTLTSGTHYTVSYSNNTNAGTATVTITGKNNYTGTVTKTFTIKQQSLSSSNVTLSYTSTTYTGNAKKPTATVKNSAGTTLTKGTDYTVTYSSGRKAIGKYTVTIKGKGNYSGTIKKTFKIVPKQVKISSLKSSSSKKLTVKWSKVSGSVTGYQIYYRVKGTSTWSKVTVKATSSSTLSKTISKLKSKKTYQVKIRAYKTVSGTNYYGEWSSVKTVKVK